jgi:ABC-2 type transport system permease protein
MRPFIAQSKSEVLRLVRSPFFLLFSVLMPISFYSIFAVLHGTDTAIEGTTWGAYSLMSMTAFSLLGTAAGQFGIRLAYERKDGLLKLLKLTPMPMSAWVSAKIAAHLLVHLLIIVVMFGYSAVVFGTEMSVWRWIASGLWLLIGSIPFLALGILLGTIRSTDAATAVSNLVYMGLSILGGLWMPLRSFPDWMQKLGEWLPSHAYANTSWSVLANGTADWLDILLLLGYGALFLIAAILVLNRRENA